MKLIVPIPYYRHGGVERVIVSLTTELSNQTEQVIITSSPKIITHFQQLIPPSEKIVYQIFSLPDDKFLTKVLNILKKLSSFCNQYNLSESITKPLKNLDNTYHNKVIFQYLINKYQITHCLYLLVNKVEPPNLNIPLFGVIHDIFWHFSPLTYDETYKEIYDQSLEKWLLKSQKIFTVSKKTQSDILKIFPEFESKIYPIPNTGFLPKQINLHASNKLLSDQQKNIIFYFPSSFGIYKDHLTLLKASIILAKKKFNFKIVLLGKDTDKLIQGKIELSQQKKTEEYEKYLQDWQSIYQENEVIIKKHFLGLGFCDDNELENWYLQSDCVLFPSQYEGFGLGIAEAIMRGIPVIASDLDVFTEQVELYQCPDRITFFAKGNAEDLAKKMESFINNPLPRLSGEKLDFYRQLWTWEKVAEQYIKTMNN